MDELQSLQHQLEEARDEAELNLLQLQQVQEELEFYFLRCQELEAALQSGASPPTSHDHTTTHESCADQSGSDLKNERDQARAERDQTVVQLEQLQREHEQLKVAAQQAEKNTALLTTAQKMLEGQARYLEDVSRREEEAAKALDRLRLLESEILHYIQNSKPQTSLDARRIRRLIQLAKQTDATQGAAAQG